MGNNTSVGVHRVKELYNSSNYTGTNTSEFANRFGDLFSTQLAGSYELSGMAILALMGFILYENDASLDVSASVLIPTIFFLGERGLLPMGEGVVFGGLVSVSAIFIFGVLKYATR